MVVVVVVCVPPEAAVARALPVADSISATTGGVTAAKRPAFSRNRRRSASFAVRFAASSGMSVPPTDHTLPSKLLGHERSSKAGSSACHLDTGSRISPKSVSPGTRGGRLP